MRLGKSALLAFLGIVAATTLRPTSTWSATIRDDEPDSGYVALGSSLDYAAVGLFVNSWGYTGCGVLIAQDWVLTAAHNLSAASSGTFTLDGSAYASTELFRHPIWNGDAFAGYDFGLVHLSSPVSNATPATLYTESLQPVMDGTFVGFGFTGTGLTGWRTLDNMKRAFQNTIDGDFGNPALIRGSDFDNPHSAADNAFGSPTPLALEGSVAPGDSGGGVFVSINSRTYLAGVISFVAATDGNPNADYGDVNGFGQVAAALPWIYSHVPEPSMSVLLIGAGLVMYLGRFYRQVKRQPKGR